MCRIEQRLSVLETQVKSLIQAGSNYQDDLRIYMEKEDKANTDIWIELSRINKQLSKNGGIATGIIIVISAIWAAGIGVYQLLTSNWGTG